MGILDTFDPRRDGWSWENLGTPELTWDQYRRTYLGISPSPTIADPLDLAFFEIFKGCAAGGNCGGLAVLSLALFKYGGYMGYGSPAIFYSGGSNVSGTTGPARADLMDVINVMQARQFSASGIRNFVDVVKAGQLNDGVAAFERIRDGLGSGDYHVISMSNGLFGDAAHTLVPYRAEQVGGTRTLWLYDPNRPYDDYPDFYDGNKNRLVITGPTSWEFKEECFDRFGALQSGTTYSGSNNGWCFAIPTSSIRHKGRQPISVGFAITNLNLLFVSGTGSVAQIEDDEGRRLFTRAGAQDRVGDLETDDDRRLPGVVPFPWNGTSHGGSGVEAYVIAEQPSSPLTVTVRGKGYRLQHLGADRLTVVAPQGAGAAEDAIRIGDPADGADAVEVRTSATRRRFDLRQVQATGAGEWHGVRVRNALVTDDAVRMRTSTEPETVEVSGSRAGREVDVEFERFRKQRLSASTLSALKLPADGMLRAIAGRFTAVPKAERRG